MVEDEIKEVVGRRQRKIWAGAFTVDSMGKNKHVRISRARTD